jgi:Mn-dependent DtxR family transcriptional regulator
MEDYLERIYQLMQDKGYARVIDIAGLLEVQSPSVTRMVQKLADAGFVRYEKYRGIVLTDKGRELGRTMKLRHATLAGFLRVLGVEDEDIIWRDVEGIEHHVSPQTMSAIRDLVSFFEANPHCHEELLQHRKSRTSDE